MPQQIILARNLQRAMLAEDVSLSENFVTDIADFREMVIGSVQAFWSDEDALTGELELWASNLPDPAYFDRIDGSKRDLNHPKKCRVWHLGVIGYRYLYLSYTKNTVTTGKLTAFTLAKISK